jgi:hypothetical protein
MKKLLMLTLLFALIQCSPEKKQEIQQNLVIQAMTNGQWKVSSFNKAGSDVTTEFSPYQFQFKNNLTVDAINGGSVEKTGNWNADANAQTITSNFATIVSPLIYLNGTWKITSTTWTSVNATKTESGETSTLRLDKL